jgi:uncharacterized protein YdaU (DUF1376 family)
VEAYRERAATTPAHPKGGAVVATNGPAFQFYARDFIVGTLGMTPAEVGLYIRALAVSWDAGPLPTDEAVLARTLMVPLPEFRKLWRVVGAKFEATEYGFVNRRLESEREKQAEYRAVCAANGVKGGRPRKPEANPRLKPPVSVGLSKEKPKTNPEETTASAICDLQSASADEIKSVRPLVSRRHPAHGWCNDRGLCVPQQQFDEFVGRLGGREHMPKLLAWLGSVIDTLGPTVPGENVFKFWGARFEQWQGSTAPQNTKGARTVAAGNRLQAALDAGAEIDPFGTKAHARKLAELTQKASA